MQTDNRDSKDSICEDCAHIDNFQKEFLCNVCNALSDYTRYLSSIDQISIKTYDTTSHIDGAETVSFIQHGISLHVGINVYSIIMLSRPDYGCNHNIDKQMMFDFLKSNKTSDIYKFGGTKIWYTNFSCYINFATPKLIYSHTAFPTAIVDLIASYAELSKY